jgi:arabinogalactan oligomer/maltooligosaccharide transport system permease protein
VKFPVILVATAPLLIASFAYNFNNFNLIRILTDGGPPISDAAISVGHTDILVTFVFDLAFGGDQALYGFASAISILIFLIVGAIAVAGFMQTKRLEEMT